MKFPRSKKLIFSNNKGGVGKTTLAFNCAVNFAKEGYKTVIVDLDPQCNITRLALGDKYYQETLQSDQKTIYNVLKGIVDGGADIDLSIPFLSVKASSNLFLLKVTLIFPFMNRY